MSSDSLRLFFDDCLALTGIGSAQDDPVVGEVSAGRVVVPTNQVLTPAGRLLTFPGRPTDLAMLEDQRTVVVKNLNNLIVLDAETGNDTPDTATPLGWSCSGGSGRGRRRRDHLHVRDRRQDLRRTS